MTLRQKLQYLIEEYYKDNYTTWDFTSQFVKIFYLENDGTLTSEEEGLMKTLAEHSKFYSPSDSDRKMYPGYKSENDIKSITTQIYTTLLKLYGDNTLKNIK